ncbi:uncharacterized protein [Periplaneta americana]|uniref:uncharacterized protein isoform X2 n=1 Tax=Periplaneta americana TaxID=6978 RepID=UPI0037E8B36C
MKRYKNTDGERLLVRRVAEVLLWLVVVAVILYLSFSTPWSAQHDFVPVDVGINPGFCDQVDPRLLVIVRSQAENTERRDAIRYTWGGAPGFDVSVAFFLEGLPDAKEAHLYHDMMEARLTPVRWTFAFCRKASLLLVVPDDVFVNVPYLLRFHPANRSLLGDRDRFLVTGDALPLLAEAMDPFQAAQSVGVNVRQLAGLLDSRAPNETCGILQSYTLSGVDTSDQLSYWWAVADPQKCSKKKFPTS